MTDPLAQILADATIDAFMAIAAIAIPAWSGAADELEFYGDPS